MGGSFDKDQKLDLYMEVDKTYYIAGEVVQGCIYINAKQTRMYEKLVVRLQGQEHIMWSEHYQTGQHSHYHQIFQNTHANYDSVFTIFDFNGQVNLGQYMFPFSFVLPAAMSGSFNYDSDCYIKYTLTARLNHPNKPRSSQLYELALNIQEPLRGPFRQISTDKSLNAKCCGCCSDYGSTRVQITVDKNLARSGDQILISGAIDNTQGKTDIEETVISLIEKRVMIASDLTVNHEEDKQHAFKTLPQVSAHGSSSFQTTVTIPNLDNYTAIGRITARYFVIRAQTIMGCCMCCADMPYAEMHIVIQSPEPKVIINDKIPPPDNWNPQSYPKVQCVAMNPFIYQSLPGIPYENQGGKTSPIIKNPMGTEMPLHPVHEKM